MAEGPCIVTPGGVCQITLPDIPVEAPRYPPPPPPEIPALLPTPVGPGTAPPGYPPYQPPKYNPTPPKAPPPRNSPPPKPPTPPETPPEVPIEVVAASTAPAFFGAAVISALLAEGLSALFDYSALPRKGDRLPIKYSGGVSLIDIDPITLQPLPDLTFEEIPTLEPITVFAHGPAALVETNPYHPGDVEIPITPFYYPIFDTPPVPRRIATKPAAQPYPLIGDPTLFPSTRGRPRVRPIGTPKPKPAASPFPTPFPSVSPGVSPRPIRTPSPPALPAPPIYDPFPGAYGSPLTGAQPGVSPLPTPKPAQPNTNPQEEAGQSSCTCPGTKTKKEQKDYGCEQGYYRETKEGITYKKWSTRKCQSSKGNSRSPPQAAATTY